MRNLKLQIKIESRIGVVNWTQLENSITASLKDKDIFQISIIPDKDKDGRTTHYYYIFYKEAETIGKDFPTGAYGSPK